MPIVAMLLVSTATGMREIRRQVLATDRSLLDSYARQMDASLELTLLLWITQNRPNTKTIVLTAHVEFIYAQEAIALKAVNYLVKPVRYKFLLFRQAV